MSITIKVKEGYMQSIRGYNWHPVTMDKYKGIPTILHLIISTFKNL